MDRKERNKRQKKLARERLDVIRHNLEQARFDPESIFYDETQEMFDDNDDY